jgi:hypothetical protein
VAAAQEKGKRKKYGGREKPHPTLIKEKEPLWYQVPLKSSPNRIGKLPMGIRRVAGLT